jgi:hypothetical protein
MSKTLSTPFSDWGNIVYIKRHKEFYENIIQTNILNGKKQKKRKRRK